jgi:hypothetical protein
MGGDISISLGDALPYVEDRVLSLFGKDPSSRQWQNELRNLIRLSFEQAATVQCVGMDTPIAIQQIYQPSRLVNTKEKPDIINVRALLDRGGDAVIRETMDRPAWIAMMVALHSDGVKTVIVENLSRLARDLMVQEAAIADFHKSGFALISVAEPDLMATDPSRIMIRQILGAVSQYDA